MPQKDDGLGDDSPTVSPLSAGLTALRRFWRPFLLIQSAAVTLGLAYRLSDSVRAACVVLGRWKIEGGVPFAAIAGAVAGGLLPELAKGLVGRAPPGSDREASDDEAGDSAGARKARRQRWSDLRFNLAFFAFDGVAVNGLYRLAARLFGSDSRPSTVLTKIAFDQFVFTPLWQVLTILLYLARQRRWSWTDTRPALARGIFWPRVLALLLPAWCFWIPIVAIVYALPGPLQFLMFAFALAAWSLIMVFIANQAGDAARD
jgi:hypothetical protein